MGLPFSRGNKFFLMGFRKINLSRTADSTFTLTVSSTGKNSDSELLTWPITLRFTFFLVSVRKSPYGVNVSLS